MFLTCQTSELLLQQNTDVASSAVPMAMKLMDEDTVYLLTITLCSCIKKSCSFLYKQQATNNSEIGKLSADFSGKQPPMDPLRSQHNSSAKYDFIFCPKGKLLGKTYENKYGHCYHIGISFL